jgi:Flp pilus assembly protein TadD
MVTVLACAVVLSVAAAASLKRSLTWQDPRSLFETMIETSPKAWVAHLGLANELVSSGHYDEAERHFVEVLRLHPADADTVSSSHHNLGVLYQIRGDHHRAVAAFRSAIAARPQSWQAYRSMAASYRYLGLVDEAAQAEKRAREILHGQPDR